MSVTMRPAEVKAVGTKAEGVGTDMVSVAAGKLESGEDDKGSARLEGFESGGALDSLFDTWTPKTSGLAECIETVGRLLTSSANIYASTDDSSGDLFEFSTDDAYAGLR